jgi:glycosyltransferase involved in cell wall biosynthesis
MRILVISDHYPPYYKGGHEIRFKITADGLSRRGHEVYVLASNYGVSGKKENDRILRLLNYLEIGHVGGFRKRYKEIKIALLGRQNYFITKKAVKYVKPDIVYAGEISHVSMYPIKAVETYSIPIVHHVGNYYFPQLVEDCILQKNPIKRFYRKAITGFKGIDNYDFRHIITVSEAVKKKYVAIGFPERNIKAIHSRGVPSQSIRKRDLFFAPDKGTIRLLYVGRLKMEKGVHVAIEAVEYLVNHFGMNNLYFDIIGEGDIKYMDVLYRLIEKLNMKNRVSFRKLIQHKDILQVYRNYEILLFPSIWEEPFSGVLIEAMSQGLPIVATRSGGTPELITDGWNGLLVPPDDYKKMAEAVYSLIQNPVMADTMASNGVDLISQKYNIEEIINRIECYLENVISEEKDVKS